MFGRILFIGMAALCALLVGACGGGSGAPPVALACTAPMLPSGAADSTFSVAAWADRDYDLVLPASYQCGTPIAVVIVYHGGGGNKESMRKIACPDGDLTSADCLDHLASAAGMAIVFPNGTDAAGGTLIDPDGVRTWNAGGGENGYVCISGISCSNDIDDVAYTRALLADIGTRISVDPKRVFASGFSDGAAMTQRLACQASDVFAAIAPVSGENQFALGGCMPAQRVAVLDIHGTLDACWPYAGGEAGCITQGLFVAVADTLADWATRNGCNPTATLTTLPPLPGINDGTSVIRHDYSGCAAGGQLEHLEVVGNGHYWPGGYEYASNTLLGGVMSRQLDTGAAVLAFFAAHGR